MPPTDQARWFSLHVQPYEPALRAYLQKRFPALTAPVAEEIRSYNLPAGDAPRPSTCSPADRLHDG
jgi:hypothetical protein